MSSWETTALRLQGNVTADSTPNSSHKSLPPLPRQKTKARTITGVKKVSEKEEDTRTKGWKPLSLSTPILLAVVALTVLLAIAVETLAQRSATQGGLALSPSLDEMPAYAKFSYLYAPTIIAVLYSMIWSWIDLDVKRMQPWFKLSEQAGATGQNSVFLDYQYDFVGLVPFKAAKRKHWPVFFGGTAMVLVFWAITPLQSALLGTNVIKQTDPATIGIRSQLVPVSRHESILDPEFLNTGYAVGWLGQPYPAFTTSKYALLPFYTQNNTAPSTVGSNITAVTTKLSTELYCWPAEKTQDGARTKSSYFFHNGQGCKTSVSFGLTSEKRMYYIGHYTSPYSSFCLGGPDCPRTPNSTHQFLAIWSRTVRDPDQQYPDFNITAIFCQPQYYKQQVLTRVNSSDLQPDDNFEQPLSPKEILTEEEFNSTAFEFMLANGMREVPVPADYPFSRVVEQHQRLNYTNFTRPVSNLVGFALAGRTQPADEYSDPKLLAEVYNNAHKYLFSLAVNKLLQNETDFSNRTATTEYYLSGVVVSRSLATAVDCLLGVVAAFTAIVLYFCRRAPSNLSSNPSSLARYIDLFRHSPSILQSFATKDNLDDDSLFKAYKDDNFKLLKNGEQDLSTLEMHQMMRKEPEPKEEEKTPQKGYYEPVKPLVLRRWSGLLFVMVLIGAMVALSYLKQEEQRLNGLYRPSENFEILQILENYIPTIFATLIEPVWVLLNRLLCVLQPFKDLWEGKAKTSHSLNVTYTSIPPQLVLWRAAKSKHFVLVLVCAMALLANLLAVGLGSLFNEKPVTAAYPQEILPLFAPKFDNQSIFRLDRDLSQNIITSAQYKDHMYVALANFSSGTKLPVWVSTEYYFQPYQLDGFSESYNLITQGFGVKANCTPVEPSEIPVFGGKPQLVTSADGKTCTQSSILQFARFQMRDKMQYASLGASSYEYGDYATAAFGHEDCLRPLTFGWGRTDRGENVNGTIEASFLTCKPIFETAKFNVTVDPKGYIISYNKTSDLTPTLDYADSKVHTDIIFEVFNRWWNSDIFDWHNDTLTRDWINHFITLRTDSRAVIDPEMPVPDPNALKPVVEDIYRRLFAILMSLNEQIFDHDDVNDTITLTRFTKETRIFMEDTSFIITITVLALNVIVASLFYVRSVAFVLPRMPTTIGSILAYVAPSRMVTHEGHRIPGQADRTFSFGRYLGSDNNVYMGIELDPHVVRIEPTSLRGKRYFYQRFWTKINSRASKSTNSDVRSGTWL